MICYEDGTCQDLTSILEEFFQSSDLEELCQGDLECLDYYASLDAEYFEQFEETGIDGEITI